VIHPDPRRSAPGAWTQHQSPLGSPAFPLFLLLRNDHCFEVQAYTPAKVVTTERSHGKEAFETMQKRLNGCVEVVWSWLFSHL